jgi:hypothetical protein
MSKYRLLALRHCGPLDLLWREQGRVQLQKGAHQINTGSAHLPCARMASYAYGHRKEVPKGQ